jgi:hypothetical protein
MFRKCEIAAAPLDCAHQLLDVPLGSVLSETPMNFAMA